MEQSEAASFDTDSIDGAENQALIAIEVMSNDLDSDKETGEEIPIFPPRSGNAVIAGGVQKGSRADIAGLENNDLIRIINGKLLRTPDEADEVLKSITYKDKLELGVIRRGRDQWERLAITIEALSEEEYIQRSIVGSNPIKYKDHWYSTKRHRESPENYGSGDIHLNIAVVDDKPEFLYLCIGRLDSEDLFTRKYTVKTDENTYELIDLPPNEVKDINSRIDALLIAEQAKVKDIIDHIKAGKPLLEDPGCDFRQFGSLSKERYERHRTKPVGNLVEMENLELHVSHACNLACQQCTHFSNFNHKGMISPEDADKQMGLWSDRLLPRYFSLLGGEPTLNPQLCEITRLARKHFPHSRLQLVTNGFNLQRHPELPAVLEETGCNLEISVHHDSAEYQAKLDPVKQLVADWENAHALRVNWRTSSSRWKRAYKGHGATMMPYEDNQPEQSWKACGSKWCPQIHDGQLWKCPQMAYLSMQAQKHGLNEAWNPYLASTPLEPTCTTEELREFVNRKSESCCGMCPANPELFELPSPLRG